MPPQDSGYPASNASEVVHEALRLLEQRQQEEAGNYTELHSRSDIKNFMDQIRTEIAAKQKPKRNNT